VAYATSSSDPETFSYSSPENQLFPGSLSVANCHDYKFGLEKPRLADLPEIQQSMAIPDTSSVSIFDDYFRCLKHELDDFDYVPEELQIKFCKFFENTFMPDLLQYLGTKHPMFRKYSIYQVELHGFEYEPGVLEGFISNEERYDLEKLEEFFWLPIGKLAKIRGKRLIGSAIRICNAMKKPEHADEFKKMAKGCFTPDTHQDPKDSSRVRFGLNVEPSTGGIQCNCHKVLGVEVTSNFCNLLRKD